MSKGVQLKDNTGEKVYPRPFYAVGDLYLTTNTTNPNLLFGGVWELFGPGRCLVCVNSSDSDFNTVKKTGGSKYLQAHTHNMTYSDFPIPSPAGGYGLASNTNAFQGAAVYSGSVRDVTTGNSGNLQPFITCYIWLRTA